MKWRDFWYFVALMALVCLCISAVACCPCRKLGESVESIERDSTYVVRHDTVHIVERETIALRPLLPSHDYIITQEQYSRLDNAYCVSTAEIDTEGLLRHSLDTKDSALMPVRTVRVEHIVRDTVVRWRTNNRTEVKVKEVVRSAWYDKALRWVSLGLFAIVIWQNRKWIGKLIGLWRI